MDPLGPLAYPWTFSSTTKPFCIYRAGYLLPWHPTILIFIPHPLPDYTKQLFFGPHLRIQSLLLCPYFRAYQLIVYR